MVTGRRLHAGIPLVFGGMIALAAGMGISRFVYTPILPYMLSSGVLDPASSGWVASANFFGYLVVGLVPHFSARTGRRAFGFYSP